MFVLPSERAELCKASERAEQNWREFQDQNSMSRGGGGGRLAL